MSEYTDMLDAGYVPADLIRSSISRALGPFEWSLDEPKLQPLTRMWEIDDLKKSFVERDGEQVMWVRFDLADKILCLLNLPHLWWGPLRRVYYRVRLDGTESHRDRPVPKGMKRCERNGCSTVFEVTGRRQHQRFCSSTCKSSAHQLKHGITKTEPRGPGRKLEALRCRNGHERTPENTRTFVRNGKIVQSCRVCQRESMKRYRQRRAQAA